MKPRQLENLGVPRRLIKLATGLIGPAISAGLDRTQLRPLIEAIVESPAGHVDNPHFGELARAIVELKNPGAAGGPVETPREQPIAWRQWGKDLSPDVLQKKEDWLTRAIEDQTRFGIGAAFEKHREHGVMDADWNITPMVRHLRDKAGAQLGTSGSGNHFVEFGVFTVDDANARALGMASGGAFLALLSHSGSRGAGAQIAGHYSRLAMEMHPHLPKHLHHLAWLSLDSAEGQEYWAAMNLMGEYAAANHAVIHESIARFLGVNAIAGIENHHNFAWKETHEFADPNDNGRRVRREVIVHRKGATPAGEGVLGVIPGSMAAPAYVVRGRGSAASLGSASHGAGRVMSRTKARETYRWPQVRDYLEHRGVKLLSAGIDEAPFVYKKIDEVMAEQQDLVETLARFDPKLVKMAPEGEKAED